MSAAGELEYGIDPTRPRRRRPASPARVPEARKSLDEGRPLSLRWDTEQDALKAAKEIVAAVRWLRVWEGLDVKVRPYVREWYVIGGEEIEARDLLPSKPERYDDHFWRTHFFVHPTLERGLRVADKDARQRSQAAAQQAKAELGLRPPVEETPKAKRTVRERGNG